MTARQMKPCLGVEASVNVLAVHNKDNTTMSVIERPAKTVANRSKSKIFRGLRILALSCGVTSSQGTTIVVIYTPKDVSIASDSLGTFGSGGPRQVCKIYHLGDVYLGVAGVDNDSATNFQVADIVFSSTSFVRRFADKMKAAASAITVTLREEAINLRKTRPSEFNRVIDPETGGVGIILVGFQDGSTFAISQNFTVSVNSSNDISVVPGDLTECPGSAGCENFVFHGGKWEHIKQFLARSRESNPDTAVRARQLVQLEIDAHTPGVGPPIDVVRITKDGPQLDPKNKTGCPIDLRNATPATNPQPKTRKK